MCSKASPLLNCWGASLSLPLSLSQKHTQTQTHLSDYLSENITHSLASYPNHHIYWYWILTLT